MTAFSLDHLSDVQFEEFSFDLLSTLGAQQISWRKGTGLSTSVADQGRDIECSFLRPEIGGGQRHERWFVECKHHKTGVPPEKIQAALAWAGAERPTGLLIIASNFLSNPCKTHLETYRQNNKPKFQIQVWELKDLERLTFTQPALLRKYGVGDDFPYLKLLHPVHVKYLRWSPLNSLQFFFNALEKAGESRFKDALGFVYLLVVNPAVRKPTDPRQTLGELIADPVSYVTFRDKCFELARLVDQRFLVRAIVSQALQWSFHFADKSDIGRLTETNKAMLSDFEDKLRTNPEDAADLRAMIKEIRERLPLIPKQFDENEKLYYEFCEAVVKPLFEEELQRAWPILGLEEFEEVMGLKKAPKSAT